MVPRNHSNPPTSDSGLTKKRDYSSFIEDDFPDEAMKRYVDPASHGTNGRQQIDNESTASDIGSTTNTVTYCFGTLDEIAFRFRTDVPVSRSQIGLPRVAFDGSTHLVSPVVCEHEHIQAQSPTGSLLAMLNSKMNSILLSIYHLKSIQVEVTVPQHVLESICGSGGRLSLGCVAHFSLNIYGSSEDAESAATELSRSGLYLQDPTNMRDGVQYNNPQSLVFADVFDTSDPLHSIKGSPQANARSMEPEAATDTDDTGHQKISEELIDLDVLLDHFAWHEDLSQAPVDARIYSPLLSHQREGLDFLMKREAPISPESMSLWTSEACIDARNQEHERSDYQHRITGVQDTQARDICGGILADDMGLGKSLVMIAIIVATTASAMRYAVALTRPPSQDREAIIAAKSTLVIVPSVLLMDTWEEEIKKHTAPHAVRCYIYHGQNRRIPLVDLLGHDIILTTYGTVASEFKRKKSLLFGVQWYRMVLDEAHVIRNAATVQFRAVTSIASSVRWCMTGTPIQNSLDDLGSLVSFLKVPVLSQPAQFRRHIVRPAVMTGKRYRKSDLRNLKLLLGSICLRRTRSIMPFARPCEQRVSVTLSEIEKAAYRSLGRSWRDKIELAISCQHSRAAHQTVLQALLRLRIFCNITNFLEKPSPDIAATTEELGSLLQQEDAAQCHYCSCDVSSFGNVADDDCGVVTTCNHAICRDCIAGHVEQTTTSDICPVCQEAHAHGAVLTDDHRSQQMSERLSSQTIPSKIQALCRDIIQHRHESKSIVFSFWKKSLDVVGAAFDHASISYLRVDGSMPARERKRILSQFATAPQGMVLIMTLGTGAVGLNNLSVANRVHILEPQWNPFVESQAIGRIARLGQTQTVHVNRYMVENSVEDMVHDGRIRKLQMATSGFGNGDTITLKRKCQIMKDLICPA